METTETQPQKGRRIENIAVVLVVLGFLLAIAGVAGYYMYSNIKWNPALIVKISTGINETSGAPIITNMTFEQSQVIYKGADAVVEFPEITVMVRNNSINAAPVSYWASVPWDSKETSGNYTLTVVFRETYTPSSNDTLILTVQQVGLKGRILNKQTAFYGWE